MPKTNTPAGFSLEAFLTRIIPGFVFLFPFFIDIIVRGGNISTLSYIELLVVTLIGLLVGELVEHIRSSALRTPIPLSYYFYKETGDIYQLPYIYRWLIKIDRKLPNRISLLKDVPEDTDLNTRLRFNFLDEMEDSFQLNREVATSRDFFDLLLLYISDDISDRTLYYSQIYQFHQNIKISMIVAGFFTIYFATMNYSNFISWIYVFSYLILLAILFFVTRFTSSSANMYMELLEKEFYKKKRIDESP